MPTVGVTLTEGEDRLVDDLVASGAYRDADDVFRESLSLIEEGLKRAPAASEEDS